MHREEPLTVESSSGEDLAPCGRGDDNGRWDQSVHTHTEHGHAAPKSGADQTSDEQAYTRKPCQSRPQGGYPAYVLADLGGELTNRKAYEWDAVQ